MEYNESSLSKTIMERIKEIEAKRMYRIEEGLPPYELMPKNDDDKIITPFNHEPKSGLTREQRGLSLFENSKYQGFSPTQARVTKEHMLHRLAKILPKGTSIAIAYQDNTQTKAMRVYEATNKLMTTLTRKNRFSKEYIGSENQTKEEQLNEFNNSIQRYNEEAIQKIKEIERLTSIIMPRIFKAVEMYDPSTKEKEAKTILSDLDNMKIQYTISGGALVFVSESLIQSTQFDSTPQNFYFGPYKAEIRLIQGETGNPIVTMLNPRKVDEGHAHPHVRPISGTKGELCLGEGESAYYNAIRQMDCVSIIQIIQAVMNTYNNGSPYCNLERWVVKSEKCIVCNTNRSETNFYIASKHDILALNDSIEYYNNSKEKIYNRENVKNLLEEIAREGKYCNQCTTKIVRTIIQGTEVETQILRIPGFLVIAAKNELRETVYRLIVDTKQCSRCGDRCENISFIKDGEEMKTCGNCRRKDRLRREMAAQKEIYSSTAPQWNALRRNEENEIPPEL